MNGCVGGREIEAIDKPFVLAVENEGACRVGTIVAARIYKQILRIFVILDKGSVKVHHTGVDAFDLAH